MCDKSKTAIQLSQMVVMSNARGAEKILMELANQPDGDNQILAVIEKLPSADLLDIIRKFDLGSPSLLHNFITPKQFGMMIPMEKQYGSEESDIASHAMGMISAIVFGENIDPNVTPADFLREMCATEEGMKEFVKFVLFADGSMDDENRRRAQIVHFMEFGTFDMESEESDGSLENHDLSWRQALHIIREQLPDEQEWFLIAMGDYKNKLNIAPIVSVDQPVTSGQSAL